jgi:(2R)-ethylmalonyl-CoA mutase
VGGIIPESDFARLKELGVQHIFTPKDYDLIAIMETNLEIAEKFA